VNVTVRLTNETLARRGNPYDKMKKGGLHYDRADTATKTNGERKRTRTTLSPVCLPTRKSSLTDSNARPSLRFFIFGPMTFPRAVSRDRSALDPPRVTSRLHENARKSSLSPSTDNYASVTIEITAQVEIRINRASTSSFYLNPNFFPFLKRIILVNVLDIFFPKILRNKWMRNILFQAMEAAYQRQHWTRTAISGSLVCSR